MQKNCEIQLFKDELTLIWTFRDTEESPKQQICLHNLLFPDKNLNNLIYKAKTNKKLLSKSLNNIKSSIIIASLNMGKERKKSK